MGVNFEQVVYLYDILLGSKPTVEGLAIIRAILNQTEPFCLSQLLPTGRYMKAQKSHYNMMDALVWIGVITLIEQPPYPDDWHEWSPRRQARWRRDNYCDSNRKYYRLNLDAITNVLNQRIEELEELRGEVIACSTG